MSESKLRKIKNLTNPDSYSDLEERLEFNQTIAEIPAQIQKLHIVGEKGVIIRVFKLTETTTTEGGLLNAKFQELETEGGRFVPKIDDFKEQARGVIIKISPEAQEVIDDKFSEETKEKLVPGAVVWVQPSAMQNRFFWDRTHPITEDNSYLSVHPNHIEGIENEEPLKIKTKYKSGTIHG